MESGGGKMKFVDLCKILQQIEIEGELVVKEECGCCGHEEEVYRGMFHRDKLGTIEYLQKFMNRKVVAIVGEPDNSYGGIIIVVKDKEEL